MYSSAFAAPDAGGVACNGALREHAGWDLNADVTPRLQKVDVNDDALRKSGVRYRL